MELFPPLTGFYEAIEEDVRIGTTHISLYLALLQQWNLNGGHKSNRYSKNNNYEGSKNKCPLYL